MEVLDRLHKISESMNTYLEGCLPPKDDGGIVEAAAYSLMAGGKRIRPALTIAACELVGGNARDVFPFAAAVECIHTYSLIHDDLPCMDNDDLRRGKPTCHKAFGEATALLAGDFLLNFAMELCLRAQVPPETLLRIQRILFRNSGIHGMIGGQGLDIMGTDSLDQLLDMYMLKTGALLKAAVLAGAVVGGAEEHDLEALSDYAQSLGVAFQIKDDLLDLQGNEELLGKPVGSDIENEKQTVVALVGVQEAELLLFDHTQQALSALQQFGHKAQFLQDLAVYLLGRAC